MREIKKPSPAERKATQEFFVEEVLNEFAGRKLDSKCIEELFLKLVSGMRKGSCAWAFKEISKILTLKICATCDFWARSTGVCDPSDVGGSPKKTCWNDGEYCHLYE